MSSLRPTMKTTRASLSPAPTPRRPTTPQPAPAARPLRGTKTPSPALSEIPSHTTLFLQQMTKQIYFLGIL